MYGDIKVERYKKVQEHKGTGTQSHRFIKPQKEYYQKASQ